METSGAVDAASVHELKRNKFLASNPAPNEISDSAIYFPIPGITSESFKSEFPLSPRKGSGRIPTPHSNIYGKKIEINNKEVALFYYKDAFYAVDEKCPHMGGPLHLGDIEDLNYNNSPCLVCPWHKWTFDLKSGKQVRPEGRQQNIQVYPVRTTSSGKISIGFPSIDPSYFKLKSMDF